MRQYIWASYTLIPSSPVSVSFWLYFNMQHHVVQFNFFGGIREKGVGVQKFPNMVVFQS